MSRVVGVDVGGTFADLVYFDEGTRTCRVAKVFSTPRNQADGMVAGLRALDARLDEIDAIVHTGPRWRPTPCSSVRADASG